ncbi:MAG: alpha-2-macroglobulin [Bacteroidetes bacterium]|nr:alpha-2-macroglobulin [Bacteroidota bacterium]
MHYRNWFFALGLLTSLGLFMHLTNNAQNQSMSFDDYKDAWAKVDSLDRIGQYASARTLVEDILAKAKSENNDPQHVKSVTALAGYISNLEEGGAENALIFVEAEVDASSGRVKHILQSALANFYRIYLDSKYWQIRDRTDIVGDRPEDIATWTPALLEARIAELFLASVQNPDLLAVSSTEYKAILSDPDIKKDLRPNLYDLLAHRALDYFSNTSSYLNQPAYVFYLDDPKAFASATTFAKAEFETQDKESFTHRALLLFQNVLQYHIDNNSSPEVKLDADLRRMQFAYNKAVMPEKDKLYKEALKALQQKYKSASNVSEAYFLEAQLLHKDGSTWRIGTQDEALRLKWKDAWKMCQEIQDRYPDTYGASLAKGLVHTIEQKSLQIQMESISPTDNPLLAEIRFRNIPDVHFRLLELDDKLEKQIEENQRNNYQQQWDFLTKEDPRLSWKVTLPKPEDFREHATEIAIDALPQGRYILLSSSSEKFDTDSYSGYLSFQVSDLASMRRTSAREGLEILVTNRLTGEPLQDADVELLEGKWNSISRKTVWRSIGKKSTEKDGFVGFSTSDNTNLKTIVTYKEMELRGGSFYSGRYYSYEPTATQRTVFFMDRSIYRPGQTIYFKSLLTEIDKTGKPSILPNTSVLVTLKDNNYQDVASLQLQSNEFGTVEGTFTAPEDRLLGIMRLTSSVGNSSTSFRVEEYKRPKFEVGFEPVEGDFKLNDKVLVEGKATAFAGNALDEVKVRYRVVRSVQIPWWRRWWYGYSPTPDAEISKGETTTDVDGMFQVEFTAEPDLSVDKESNAIFRYTVYADVIDGTGETHSATTSLRVGYVGLEASINVPDIIRRDSFYVVPFSVNNLNGQAVDVTGNISLEQLQPPMGYIKSRNWEIPDLPILSQAAFEERFPNVAYTHDQTKEQSWEVKRSIWDTPFDTRRFRKIPVGKEKLESGVYKLTLNTTDEAGNEIKAIKIFRIFDTDSKRIPGVYPGWKFFDQAGTLSPGETMTFWMGNPTDKEYFLVETIHSGHLINREWVEANKLASYSYEIKEKDRGALKFQVFSVFDDRYTMKSINPMIPWDNKELEISFRTFRDKLLPGEEETWEIVIKGPNGAEAAAEMVGALYDASLDEIVKHNWSGISWPTNYGDKFNWQVPGFTNENVRWYFNPPYTYPSSMQKKYKQLIFQGNLPYSTYGRRTQTRFLDEAVTLSAEPAPAREEAAGMVDMDADGVVARADSAPPPPPPPPAPGGEANKVAEAPEEGPEISVRTNLDETVFFMPKLRTDAEGNVILQFTMNEALTKWKFLGFAHTKDLKTGQITAFVQTQKPLMVQPNPPRFYREGDEIEFTSKVVNLSEETLSGNVHLELVNPLETIPVYKWIDNPDFNRNFSLEPGRSTSVSWRFKVPDITDVPVMEHTVVAQAGDYSDAERDAVPVLSNRQLVTESLPLAIRGSEEKTFTFNHLKDYDSESLSHAGFTLEFTSNPAWYAVQALPYMMEYPHECSEQIFSRFYANSLATSVANSSPGVKEVFEAWKGTDAMESKLSLNEELKSALLAETPWVLQAQSEAAQKQNIGLLFDLHRMATEQAKALAKLQDRQLPSGGFPWFVGGRDNWYITQYIVEGLGHLDKLGVKSLREDAAAWNMTKSAVGYIDRMLVEHYEELERAVKEGKTNWDADNLSHIAVHYLYARSFFLEDKSARASTDDKPNRKAETYLQLDGKIEDVVAYYAGQAEKYWNSRNQYMQGMIGLALKRMGKGEIPALIVKALDEQAVRNEELGAYWLYPGGYYWYQHPTETHALMIELFDEVAQDAEMVELLKIWLLKNKQTNHWSSTKATAAAVYALLMNGDNWLAETQPVQISLGGKAAEANLWNDQISRAQENAEAGTGYFKTRFNGDVVTKDMASVEVNNPNKGIAWGAVYWQYMEDLDKIEHFEETPLKIVKEVFLVKQGDRGEELIRLDEGARISPGDKLKVRIELRVDRSMNYVHMKDMRASGFEPIQALSQYKWQDGLGYYESPRDVATDFFFSYLPKGTHVFEYPLRVIHKGDFSNGITTIQCMYAPEFTSHSEGIRLTVE